MSRAASTRRFAGRSSVFHRQAHSLQRAQLEGALRRVVANFAVHGPRDHDGFREGALRDLLALQDRLVTIENIQKTVAEYYKIRVADLLSKRRRRSIDGRARSRWRSRKDESQLAGDRRCFRRARPHGAVRVA